MPASSILIFAQDESGGEQVRAALSTAGYAIETVLDQRTALARARGQSLVILNAASSTAEAIDFCRTIRAAPDLVGMLLLCISPGDRVEERIHFLEAGADDAMARPFDNRELEARVEALLLRKSRTHDLGPMSSPETILTRPRRSVAVFSPRGGVGATTIAVNIAVSQATAHPDRVLLIDLDMQFGAAATFLNLSPRQTLADLARDGQSQREPQLLRTYAAKHPSGLHLLAAPGTPELAELLNSTQTGQIIDTALEAYDQVVLDAGSTLDDRALAAMDVAETVIIPLRAEMAVIRAVHSLLDYLNEVGSIPTRSLFVLNHTLGSSSLTLADVESGIGASIGAELPWDPLVYIRAINEGNPLVLGASRSPAAMSLVRLAAAAFGGTPDRLPLDGPRKRSGIGGLFRHR